MQIEKQQVFNIVENSKNDRHFIFVCGNEIDDNTEWVKSTLRAEVVSVEELVDIPQDKNVFVVAVSADSGYSDIDNAVINFCVENNLDYCVLSLNETDIIQFFQKHCGYALVFGEPRTEYLQAMVDTFTMLDIPYNVYT